MKVDAERAARYAELGLWTDDRVGDLVSRQAELYPDRELFCINDTRVTYGQFSTWVEAAAVTMVAHGVQPGDRVLVQLPNCLEALVLQAAAFRIGAIDVPVVPIYREHETAQIIADCRPAVVAAAHTLGAREPHVEIDTALADLGHSPVLKLIVGGDAVGWVDIVREPYPSEINLPRPLAASEPALILYTSGTTSAPKGALLSSRALFAHLRNFVGSMRLDDTTVFAAATPLSHLGGFVAGLMLPSYLGARSVIMPAWNVDEAVRLIDRERVSVMMGATVFLQDLIDRYAQSAGELHRLGLYLCAGSAIPPSLIHDAAAAGIKATRNYGMTETAGMCTAASDTDPLEIRAQWDGRLLPGMEIEVVDDRRQRLPDGQIGELRIRGAQLFEGYTSADATAAQVDQEGFFYPGDVGEVRDGWVRMTGRSKDIVNRGGEKFSTQDIETALLSHPAVARAAVTAVHSDRFGEDVGAWVVLREGEMWRGAQHYLEHLERLKLARAKFPRDWHVVNAIPATASGKIQKFRLAGLSDVVTELEVRYDSAQTACDR